MSPAHTAAPVLSTALHSEPYIMFSTDKKSLLCIRCFRDMQGESRAHCVDLESAYVQGCERLEQAVLAVKALQTATKEAIALLQAMVEEVRHSAAEEEAAIHALFGSMQELSWPHINSLNENLAFTCWLTRMPVVCWTSQDVPVLNSGLLLNDHNVTLVNGLHVAKGTAPCSPKGL
ncbi:ring finger protein 207 [Cricetulus griseus]